MTWRAILLGLLLWLMWRWWRQPRRKPRTQQPTRPQVENMVRCARCGLHVTEREALQSDGRFYCSAQHRLEDGR
ncbi:MAG: PP0621 family protein [Gammaproteobacteria bacterium]